MTYDEITQLCAALEGVMDTIDASEHRHESTAYGELAESDYESIQRARSVMFRLGLWVKYPGGAEDCSYLLPKAEPVPA